MKLEITNIKSNGFRNGDFEINFDNSRNINLFLMANGDGKTTTINLIKHALSGTANKWDHSEDNGFDTWRHPDKKSNQGIFEVQFKFNNDIYKIILQFDFSQKTTNYTTVFPGSKNNQLKYNPPNEIKRLLNKEMIELLFFDLSRSRALFNEESLFNARVCIEKFLRIDLIHEFEGHLEKYKQNARSKKLTNRQIEELSDDLDILKQRRDSQIEERKKKRESFEKITKEIDSLVAKKEDIISQNQEMLEEQKQLEIQKKELLSTEASLYKNFFKLLLIPTKIFPNILDRTNDINQFLEKKKLPEPDAKALIEDILNDESKKCLCDRELNSTAIEALKKNKDLLIGSESSSILNNLKSDLKNLNEDEIIDPKEFLDQINQVVVDIKNIDEEISDNEKSLENTDINAINNKIDILEAEQISLDAQLKEIERSKTDAMRYENKSHLSEIVSIEYLNFEIQKKDEELNIATDFEKENKKISKLKTLIKESINIARKNVADSLIASCNEKIANTLAEKTIKIKSIQERILLDGKSQGSKGQTATLGYLFMISLSELASVNLPIFIDNPVDGMDGGNRLRVSNLFGKIPKQFMVFIYDEEKSNFTTEMFDNFKDKIFPITKWNKKTFPDLTIKLSESNVKKNDIYESENSFIVYDENFFKVTNFLRK